MFEGLFLPRPTDDTSRTIDDALRRYFTTKKVSDVEDYATDKLFGIHDLDRENQELDIALKKRALGLQDSQDLNETPTSSILAALGIDFNRRLKPAVGMMPKQGSIMPIIKELENVGARIRSSSTPIRRAIGLL